MSKGTFFSVSSGAVGAGGNRESDRPQAVPIRGKKY